MRVSSSVVIGAAPELVAAVYCNVDRWPEIFPTIHGVRVTSRDDRVVEVDVDHDEGLVPNTLTRVGPHRVILSESKRLYDADFDNRFDAVDGGTRFTVIGDIRLKGALRILAPIARYRARRLMFRYQLVPVKDAAESRTG